MTIDTLYGLVRNSVEKFADRVAFSMYDGEELTYAEVGRRIARVQEILCGAGLRAGDKVALLSSNMPNWGVCYYAVTTAGMIVVPILPDFSGEELDMIIEHSEARALLVSDRLFTKLSRHTIERLNVVVRTKNLGVISQRVRGEGSMSVPSPDDLAVIIYTSGTTSKPKGVMLTHRALCAQVDMSAAIFPIGGGDVFLSVLPLSHTYECSIGMIYPFSMGARVVYLDRPPTASALMPALRAVRPTVMLIVPLIIEKIYRHQVLAKFHSNGFWRSLYRVGFTRRYLHRVAGKKLMKLFGGRLRFLGIGGAKLDRGAEQFLLEARVRADGDGAAAGRCRAGTGAARFDGSRCSGCGTPVGQRQSRHAAGRDRRPHAERHAGVFQESRRDPRGLHGRRMVPHGRPGRVRQGRLALHQGAPEEHDRRPGR